MSKDKSLEILGALAHGGIVISDRNTGKSRAIAMLAKHDPKGVIVVGVEGQKNALVRHLMDMGLSETAARQKVLHTKSAVLKNEKYTKDLNIYVDELYTSGYEGAFKSAVTSYPFNVKIVG